MSNSQKFYQQFDAITGKMEWKVVEDEDLEDEDMVIQIARSNFGDMIFDYDRNERFSAGLKHFIDRLKAAKKPVHVVDIGTGTGLLSMMAAQHGADDVTAVEVFNPMAITAEKIVARNGFQDRIKVIHSRSTDVDSRHVSKKGDVIVAEVFDTELIGEGALRSFKEGLATFGKPNCRVVPCTGKIWICPVAAPEIQKFRKLPENVLKAPFEDCRGVSAVFDVQLSEFPDNWFKVLGDPFVAFDFNFEDADSIIYNERVVREFEALADGVFDTILFWWDVDMDDSQDNVISTVPRQFSDKYKWRDHWMQALYFLPESLPVKQGDDVGVVCAHDEYSLWFGIPDESKTTEATVCTCQLHLTLSRYDFYRMNMTDQNKELVEFVQQLCRDETVLTFGDGSLMSLYAATTADKVLAVETGFSCARMIQGYAKTNKMDNIQVVGSADKFKQQLEGLESVIVLAEPFFSTSILPWHDLVRYTHLIEGVKKMAGDGLKLEIYPNNARLVCLPVKFEHLWKIAAPVGVVEGFDLTDFDDICQKARKVADPIVEQHPLFEYPSVATGQPVQVFSCDFLKMAPETVNIVQTDMPGTNGLVFWMDYAFEGLGGKRISTSNGLTQPVKVGSRPQWHPGHNQGVYFVPIEKAEKLNSVRVTITTGDVDLGFQFKCC